VDAPWVDWVFGARNTQTQENLCGLKTSTLAKR